MLDNIQVTKTVPNSK